MGCCLHRAGCRLRSFGASAAKEAGPYAKSDVASELKVGRDVLTFLCRDPPARKSPNPQKSGSPMPQNERSERFERPNDPNDPNETYSYLNASIGFSCAAFRAG